MAMLTQYDPLRDTVPLFAAMDRLFRDSFVRPFGWPSWSGWSSVPVDVEETPEGYIITASLPGWRPEDVNVTVQEGTLTISGEHKADPAAEEGKTYLVRERSMDSFRRTITFGAPVNPDQAQATYENGILTLNLPKAESARPKVIKLGQTGQKQIAGAKAK